MATTRVEFAGTIGAPCSRLMVTTLSSMRWGMVFSPKTAQLKTLAGVFPPSLVLNECSEERGEQG